VADAATEATAAPMLRKKEFFERVAALSGARKREAREIGEIALEVLGAALAAGEEVNLPPFGKARVSARRPTGGGEMLTVKLRRRARDSGPAGGSDDEALADRFE
jgi:DNA-binding protein HU-alpha